jgi:geranylgeranyl diphosphate synthase type II
MYTEEHLLKLVNDYIANIKYSAQPDGLYAPIKYTMAHGGKRIRPVLMLMAYNLYKEDVSTIVPNAVGLEVYHNFTLLHDDLMDKADIRRGMPTVHKKWDANTAILSGDTMLILAYKLMGENKNEYFSEALDSFTEATLGVCEGQQYDMEFENRTDVTEVEYMEMIRLKTSLLLAYALKIGAQLAGAPAEDAQHLYNFGEKIGLAFQLQDDLLDVYGDPEIFGKKIGGDIICNKKTFMLINALNRSNEEQRKILAEWIEKQEFNANEKIAAVTRIYDEIDIKTICTEKIDSLFAQSLANLEKVHVAESKKSTLKEFAINLMGRKH